MSLAPSTPRGGPLTAAGAGPALLNVTMPPPTTVAAAAKKPSISYLTAAQPSRSCAHPCGGSENNKIFDSEDDAERNSFESDARLRSCAAFRRKSSGRSKASKASRRASRQLPPEKRPVTTEEPAVADDSDVTLAAESRKRRTKTPVRNDSETLWERWWPFAFAVAPPQLDDIVTRENARRRRERIRRLRKYDEGRDFEQFTDSYQGDSSQGSIGADEQVIAPETPAGHYSKAHPYYKKLRLPTGRRVDITRRNYFLRKWRDRKVKTTYHVFAVLTALFLLVCLVIYAYKENLPWLYNIINKVREVAKGTPEGKRRSTPVQQLHAQWRAATPAADASDDDYVTETSDASSEGTGTPGGAFASDDDM
ncbi:uncharacterized protein LOC144110973 [Amblyomma americanum]